LILKKLKINCGIKGKIVSTRDCISCGLCLPPPILKKLFEGVEFQPNQYGITELVSPCLRKSYFTRKYWDRAYTLQDLYILGRGKAFHSWFNEFFSLNEVKLVKHFKNFNIIGIVDAIEQTKEGIIMYEIKSVSKPVTAPYPHHTKQLQGYYSLAKETMEIDKLRLIYLSMNKFSVFDVKKVDITKWLYNRAKKLHNSIIKNKVPEIEDRTLCFFCPFKAMCELTESVEKFKDESIA